jgi:hypothetical protein
MMIIHFYCDVACLPVSMQSKKWSHKPEFKSLTAEAKQGIPCYYYVNWFGLLNHTFHIEAQVQATIVCWVLDYLWTLM